MAVSHHKYSDGIIQHLQEILFAENSKGTPKDFEVRIDNGRIIPRTKVVDLFETFPAQIKPESLTVTVIIYRGASQHNDTYVMYLRETPFGPTLDGTDIDEQVAAKLAEQEKNYKLSGLQKTNRKLRRKLKTKKKYIAKLEDTILENKANRFKLGSINIGELGSYAVEGMVRRNTQWLRGLPMGEALAGAIEADNAEQAKALESGEQSEPQGQASFQKAGAATAPQFTEEQLVDMATGGEIRKGFTQEQLPELGSIIRALAARPDLLGEVNAFITQKTGGN